MIWKIVLADNVPT